MQTWACSPSVVEEGVLARTELERLERFTRSHSHELCFKAHCYCVLLKKVGAQPGGVQHSKLRN